MQNQLGPAHQWDTAGDTHDCRFESSVEDFALFPRLSAANALLCAGDGVELAGVRVYEVDFEFE